jgi:hypothetical protein
MLFLLLFSLLQLLFYLFSLNAILCEGADDLPTLMQFSDLHLTESLKAARAALKGTVASGDPLRGPEFIV